MRNLNVTKEELKMNEIIDWALFRECFGWVAAIVSFVAHPLYIASILRREEPTRPNVFTWVVAACLSGVDIWLFPEAGGKATRYMLWGDTIGFFLIAAVAVWMSIRNHREEEWGSLGDWFCFWGALVAIWVYINFHNALWAFGVALFAEFLGALPTIIKTWKDPKSEDFLAWKLTQGGNTLNFLAIEWGNIAEMLYVSVIFLIDGVVWLAIFRGRRTPREKT